MRSSRKLEDIIIYKESLLLVKEVFDLCKNTTLRKEWSLCDQIKRASVSIPANIAEGYGRKTKADFAQFLSIALGSCNEVLAFLDVMKISFNSLDVSKLREEYNVIGKRIYSFRRKLLTSHNT